MRNALAFRPPRGRRGILGAVLVAYAIVGYPVVGAAVGHVYPAVPVLGLAPCPTTLLTGGILLWAAAPVPRLVALVPFAWSLVGLSAAVRLGMVEDLGLALSAVACASALRGSAAGGGCRAASPAILLSDARRRIRSHGAQLRGVSSCTYGEVASQLGCG